MPLQQLPYVLGSKLPPSDQVPTSTSNFAATVMISIPHAHGSLLSGIRVLVSPEPFIFEQPCPIYCMPSTAKIVGQMSSPDSPETTETPFLPRTFYIPVSTRISWLYTLHCSGLSTQPFTSTELCPSRRHRRTVCGRE